MPSTPEPTPARPSGQHDATGRFTVLNGQGQGNAIVVCDHASKDIPPELDSLGLPEALIETHIGWDIGAADVSRRLAALIDAPLVLNGTSRLVIDPNRPLGHPESIMPESDGITIPGNRGIGTEEAERRARLYFHPYQQAVAETLAAIRARGVEPAFISVHSFVPEMKGFRRPWEIGLLHAEDTRLADALRAALVAAHPDIVVGDNEPYSGMSESRNTVRQHAEIVGLANITIELRHDLIATRPDAEMWAERLAAAFEGPLADPHLRRPLVQPQRITDSEG